MARSYSGKYEFSGFSVQVFLANSKGDAIIDFFQQVKTANATAKAVVIALDNYSSHCAAKVRESAQELGIYLIHLPPYSPDLNPIVYPQFYPSSV